MKFSKHPTDSRKLTAAVQNARKTLAKANADVDTASQLSSVAKRQRKEARAAARLAASVIGSFVIVLRPRFPTSTTLVR
jgi:hypothetical protein